MTALDTIKQAILGVPYDPNLRPDRVKTVQAFAEMQTQLEASQSGALAVDIVGNLPSGAVPSANIMAWVLTGSGAGIYSNTGSALSPVWTRRGDIPQFVVTGINSGAGTGDAIQITTDLAFPTQDGRAMLFVPIVATNTINTPTVSVNGGAPLTIVSNNGNPITIGALIENSYIAGFKTDGGTKLRLISDQSSTALVAAAEAAAVASEASAVRAEAAAEAAEGAIITPADGSVTMPKLAADVVSYIDRIPPREDFSFDNGFNVGTIWGAADTVNTSASVAGDKRILMIDEPSTYRFFTALMPVDPRNIYCGRGIFTKTVNASSGTDRLYFGVRCYDKTKALLGVKWFVTGGAGYKALRVAEGTNEFAGIITGEGAGINQFNPGTRYVRVVCLPNNGVGTGGITACEYWDFRQMERGKFMTAGMFGCLTERKSAGYLNSSFQEMFDYLKSEGGLMYIEPGTFDLTTAALTINGGTKPFVLLGAGRYLTTLRRRGAGIASLIDIEATDNWEIGNFGVDGGTTSGFMQDGFNIRARSCSFAKVKDVRSVAARNTSIYMAAATAGQDSHCIVDNCFVDGNDIGNNGILIGRLNYSGIRNSFVRDLVDDGAGPGYGLQVKELSVACFIENSTAANCKSNIACGQEDNTGVQDCRFSNITSWDPKTSHWEFGWGLRCKATGIKMYGSTNGVTQYGLSLSGGSQQNSFDILCRMSGTGAKYALNARTGAVRNSIRFTGLDTSTFPSCLMDSGSQLNVVTVDYANAGTSPTDAQLFTDNGTGNVLRRNT